MAFSHITVTPYNITLYIYIKIFFTYSLKLIWYKQLGNAQWESNLTDSGLICSFRRRDHKNMEAHLSRVVKLLSQ